MEKSNFTYHTIIRYCPEFRAIGSLTCNVGHFVDIYSKASGRIPYEVAELLTQARIELESAANYKANSESIDKNLRDQIEHWKKSYYESRKSGDRLTEILSRIAERCEEVRLEYEEPTTTKEESSLKSLGKYLMAGEFQGILSQGLVLSD